MGTQQTLLEAGMAMSNDPRWNDETGHSTESLLELMLDTHTATDIRRDAMVMVGRSVDPRGIEPLLALLRWDDETIIRGVAAYALGTYYATDPRVIEPLITALRSDQPVRLFAAREIARLGDKTALIPVVAQLYDGDARVRASAALDLGGMGDQLAIGPLLGLLFDDAHIVRNNALHALDRLDGFIALRRLLTNAEAQGRRLIVDTLAIYGGYPSYGEARHLRIIPLLQDHIADSDALVRAAVVEGLGFIGTSTEHKQDVTRVAFNSLITALDDVEADVRAAAAWAVGQLEDDRAVKLLLQLFDDPAVVVRVHAVAALGQLSLSNRVASEVAKRAHRDTHPTVRHRAAALGGWNVREDTGGFDGHGPDPAIPRTDVILLNATAHIPQPVLPQALHAAITQGMDAMRAHPEHHLVPALRRRIYEGFGPRSDQRVRRARSLLALGAARRALECGETDHLNCIPIAEEVLAGMRRYGDARWFLHGIYGGQGPDERRIGWTAVYGEEAARVALGEVLDGPDLDQLDQGPNVEDNIGMIPIDAAATAAMAEAWDDQMQRINANWLRGFWEWWLTEAIPAAWAASAESITAS